MHLPLWLTTKVFRWALTHIANAGVGGRRFEGARSEYTLDLQPGTELRITLRDTTQENTYSREELVQMLRLIRQNEARMNWKTPEEWGTNKDKPVRYEFKDKEPGNGL